MSMPKFQHVNNLNEREFGEKLSRGIPFENLVTFKNGKQALIKVEPLSSSYSSTNKYGSYGLVFFDSVSPEWAYVPSTIGFYAPKAVKRSLNTYSNVNSVVGIGFATSDYLGYSATMRIMRNNGQTFSPKYYSSGWKGGSPSKIKTYKVTALASKAVFFVGMVIDITKAIGKQESAAKAITNIAFSAIATVGGIPGFMIGTIYCALDMLGAFDYNLVHTTKDKFIAPVDNLRVALPDNYRYYPPIKRQYHPKLVFISPASFNW